MSMPPGKRFMWSQNAFTDRPNLKWPILQAPMGWLSTPALAAAVSNGGLGGLGMWGFSAEEAERRIAGFQQLSGGRKSRSSWFCRELPLFPVSS
jgi:nitronate monooxygenase